MDNGSAMGVAMAAGGAPALIPAAAVSISARNQVKEGRMGPGRARGGSGGQRRPAVGGKQRRRVGVGGSGRAEAR